MHIDIDALRRARPPRRPAGTDASTAEIAGSSGWSRRHFLGATGAVTAGLLPGAPLPLDPFEPLTVARQGGMVAVRRGRRTLWTLDAALFVGTPRRPCAGVW